MAIWCTQKKKQHNFIFFTKRFRTHQKHQKAPKKHQKAQETPKNRKSIKKQKSTKKHKNATKQKHKTQISEQKLKMRLKNVQGEKSNLFAYLRFCVFCAREEKKLENKKIKSLCNVIY